MAADAYAVVHSVGLGYPAAMACSQPESIALCTSQTQIRPLSTSSTSRKPDGMFPDLQPLWHFNSDDLPDLLAEEPVSDLPEDMRISSADLLATGSLKLYSAELMMCSDTLQLHSDDIPDLLAYDSADEGSSSTLQHHRAFSPSWNIANSANPSATWQAAMATDPHMLTDIVPAQPVQKGWQRVVTASTSGLGLAGAGSVQRHAGTSSDSQQSGHAAATSQQAAAPFEYPREPVAASSWSAGQMAWPHGAARAHIVQMHPHAWNHGAASTHNTSVHMHPHSFHDDIPGYQVGETCRLMGGPATACVGCMRHPYSLRHSGLAYQVDMQTSGEMLMETLEELGISIDENAHLSDIQQPGVETASRMKEDMQWAEAGQTGSATANSNSLTLPSSSGENVSHISSTRLLSPMLGYACLASAGSEALACAM